jgi:hypothetical protein
MLRPSFTMAPAGAHDGARFSRLYEQATVCRTLHLNGGISRLRAYSV